MTDCSDVGAFGELVAQRNSEDRQKGNGRGNKEEIHGEKLLLIFRFIQQGCNADAKRRTRIRVTNKLLCGNSLHDVV